MTEVDNSHQRHALIVDALGQIEQLVLAGNGVVITLERWRGAAEHNRAFLDFCPHDRDVASVIAGRFFLLVGRLVFFIDNDESKLLEWREHRAAGTDHDPRPPGMDLVPFIVALAFGQMTVQNGNDFVQLGKTAFEALDCLGGERNFRDENDRTFAALERSPDRLQIDFGFAAAGDAVQQNRFGRFGRSQCVGDFAHRESLFRIQLKVCRRNKLLVRMWIAFDRFFAQVDQAALGEGPQGLVIERSLAQQLRGRHRFLQFCNRFEQFGLTRGPFSQVVDLVAVDLCQRLHEELFFPADLCAPDHLRQQAAHDGFERAAIISAHPLRQLEQRLTDCRRFAHQRFNRPNSLRVAVLQRRKNRGERGFVAKRNSHSRPNPDSLGQCFRHGIIKLALNGAVDNHANVIRLHHLAGRQFN